MDDEDDYAMECKTCNLLFRGAEPYKQHISGKGHKKRVKFAEALNTLKNISINDEDEDFRGAAADDGGQFFCSDCNKKCSGFESYSQHLKSGPHFKQLKRNKLIEDMKKEGIENIESADSENIHPALSAPFATCEDCNKQFGGPESYHMHLESNKHHCQLLKNEILVVLTKECTKEGENSEEGDTKRQELEKFFKNIDDGELLQALKENVENQKSGSTENNIYNCKICKKSFTGHIPFVQHYLSPVHKKQMKKLQALDRLKNKEQEISISSEESDAEEFRCELCSMLFTDPESFLAHQKSKKHRRRSEFIKFKSGLGSNASGSSSHHRQDDKTATKTITVSSQAPDTVPTKSGIDKAGDLAIRGTTSSVASDTAVANEPGSQNPTMKEEGIQTEKKHSKSGKFVSALKAGIKEI